MAQYQECLFGDQTVGPRSIAMAQPQEVLFEDDLIVDLCFPVTAQPQEVVFLDDLDSPAMAQPQEDPFWDLPVDHCSPVKAQPQEGLFRDVLVDLHSPAMALPPKGPSKDLPVDLRPKAMAQPQEGPSKDLPVDPRPTATARPQKNLLSALPVHLRPTGMGPPARNQYGSHPPPPHEDDEDLYVCFEARVIHNIMQHRIFQIAEEKLRSQKGWLRYTDAYLLTSAIELAKLMAPGGENATVNEAYQLWLLVRNASTLAATQPVDEKKMVKWCMLTLLKLSFGEVKFSDGQTGRITEWFNLPSEMSFPVKCLLQLPDREVVLSLSQMDVGFANLRPRPPVFRQSVAELEWHE